MKNKNHELVKHMFRDLYRSFDTGRFLDYYNKDTRWHTAGVEFGFDEMYQHFLSSRDQGFKMQSVIHQVKRNDNSITVWVTHKRHNEKNINDRNVNTMVNYEINNDSVINASFMWDLPVEVVMPTLKHQEKPKLHDIQTILTPMELRCFFDIIQGLTIKDIAKKYHRSPRTIQTHCEHIKQKLDLQRINQCASYAHEHGLMFLKPLI